MYVLKIMEGSGAGGGGADVGEEGVQEPPEDRVLLTQKKMPLSVSVADTWTTDMDVKLTYSVFVFSFKEVYAFV